MIVWDWLSEINLMRAACILSNESGKRFSDADFNKHLPQKRLKPFLINLIETTYINVFIIPMLTKFQIAAGNILSQLKKKYRRIKIILIGFSDFDANFRGEYLHIGWRLKNDATKYVAASIDNDEQGDSVKIEVLEYLHHLKSFKITEDYVIRSFMNHWKLGAPQESPLQKNTDKESQALLQSKKYAHSVDKHPLNNNRADLENTGMKRRQLKKLNRKTDSTESEKCVEKNIRTGLHHKYVVWPAGYCRYHNCVLDEMDIVKRKCVLRKGRKGICFHLELIDENRKTLAINKNLYY